MAIHAQFPPLYSLFPMFQDPMDKSQLNLKTRLENFTTNIEWNALKTTLS